MPRQSGRAVGALNGDGAGHLVASPVRKEKLNKKSKKELAKEAARVLNQADKVGCISQDKGIDPEKFYTLPSRKKNHFETLEKNKRIRKNSLERDDPPDKPPRNFTAPSKDSKKVSIFDIFKKSEKTPKKSNLKRSVSDASHLKSKTYGPGANFRHGELKRSESETDDTVRRVKSSKKQLTPIIEDTQRNDYFSKPNESNKENDVNENNVEPKSPARKKWKKTDTSVTESLKKYIDEVDEALYKETGLRISSQDEKIHTPEVVYIDVDKAQKISNTKNSKLKNSLLGKKIKSLASRKPNKSVKEIEPKSTLKSGSPNSPAPIIKRAIEGLEKDKHSVEMIHSSQKPADKLPLTKGHTVDKMVKRLSHDSSSPPPKTNILVTPNISVQHNNNQPFSYTRGLSPDKYPQENSSGPSSPIIYAQVVCANGASGPSKQTVHTVYTNHKKHPQHSDSDEGLGYEDHFLSNRKYDRNETTFKRHFEDTRYSNNNYHNDKFVEEIPITPKFKSNGYSNGYSSYEKSEHILFPDLSSRGRGDGMDSKRRESLSEPFENGFSSPKPNGNVDLGRKDLSARRDLLESRINRRISDKALRSPDFPSSSPPITKSHVFLSEAKYYRNGSNSPGGYKEKYVSQTRTDQNGERYTTESRTKQYFNDETRHKENGYVYEGEPKSFDSQLSDYRSSPETRLFEASHNKSNDRYNAKMEKHRLVKDRSIHKSNPEINKKSFDDRRFDESYHDSLRREKQENRMYSSYKEESYVDHSESERKDKFIDSGIENDFKRDSSGDNFKLSRTQKKRTDYAINDSEDEGFASSLLIASEKLHAEENANRRKNGDYDSDRACSREDEYRRRVDDTTDYSRRTRQEYAPRERSIDDGSHYDPRIDKNFEKERGTLKKIEKKPPKPEKKSGLEKVKQLFSRDSKKKKEKPPMVREESLRARYKEYRGSHEILEPSMKKKEVPQVNANYYDYNNRRRLSTPSPSPTRNLKHNGKAENTHSSWFKSLDRLSRKKNKKDEKEGHFTSTEDEQSSKPTPTKSLRFFGDTDLESNDSVRYKPAYKSRSGSGGMSRDHRIKSQSSRDLHNISEEIRTPDLSNARKNGSHKSMLNISDSEREGRRPKSNLKPPMSPVSPTHRLSRNGVGSRSKEDRSRSRRKNEVSSVESSTEGDSSQQSQRSVVYLHAATVGDIPGPGYLRNGRRAASREELASNGSGKMQPQVKTLSRSFSVLAPWKPRHYKEGMELDYTQYPKSTKNGKYDQKPSRNGGSRKETSSTLKKKAQETRKSNQNISNLNHISKSKENISSQSLKRSKDEQHKHSTSSLYKKRDKLPRENSRYTRERDDRKIASKSMSVESLGNTSNRSGRRGREDARDVSRSTSMPRNPDKSAGWFRMNNNKSKKALSSQRL